jgi:hypothetical protein
MDFQEQEYRPIHFIEEPIEPIYKIPPVLEKKPACPDGFRWRNELFWIVTLAMEWRDYGRRGKYARNMQPQHAAVARTRGSWGVGKFYFRVVTDTKRIFDIYYDRSPKDVDERKGSWHVYQELVSTTGSGAPLNSSSDR